MADAKLSALTEATTLAGDEYVYVVDDPAGTPVDRRVTVTNLLANAIGVGGFLISGTDYYGVPGLMHRGRGTKGLSADVMLLEPFVATVQLTITNIAVRVFTAAASSSCRLGVYAADRNGIPTSLVLDAGAIDSSTTGIKAITGLSTALPVGRYLAVVVSNGAPTLQRATMSEPGGSMNANDQFKSLSTITASVTYGALPAAGSVGSLSYSFNDANEHTVVFKTTET